MDNDTPDVGRKRRDRMRDILERVREQGSTSTDELIRACGVSAATVRRDLSELEARGARPAQLRPGRGRGARPGAARRDAGLRGRRRQARVGRLAARLLPPGRQAVAVSGGTTTQEVVRALGDRNGLTVITNAVTIALEVSRSPRVKTILTGGTLRPPRSRRSAPWPRRRSRAFKVTTAFLGTDGISAAGGVTTHDDTEARTNGVMVTHADRVVVVCDGSKVGRQTMARMADIGDVSVLVTDEHAPREALEQIAAAGVEVLIA